MGFSAPAVRRISSSGPGPGEMLGWRSTAGWTVVGGSLRTMSDDRWTMHQLRAELVRFEVTLRAADLQDTTVRTYVDRSGRFLDWLDGKYEPRGPNAT